MPLPTAFASHRRTPSRAVTRVASEPAEEEEEAMVMDEEEAEAPTCPLPPATAAATTHAQRCRAAAAAAQVLVETRYVQRVRYRRTDASMMPMMRAT